MGFWLEGWSGDNAGKVVGRAANRLLVTITHTDGTFPTGYYKKGDLFGTPWHYETLVTCLTPGAREAIATSVEAVNNEPYVLSIELAEVDYGGNKTAWEPGVHLFSVRLVGTNGNQATALTSAIIDDRLKRVDLSLLSKVAGPWMLSRPFGH
jgi:hypothetical protein